MAIKKLPTNAIESGAITSDLIGLGEVNTNDIADDNVTYDKIQNVATANRVLGSTTANGVVSEVQVQTSMIADDAVTSDKLGPDAVDATAIGAGQIAPSKLSTGHPSWDTSGNATISGNLSYNAGYGSAAPVYGCRAWVNFNGSAYTNVGGEDRCILLGSGNISKVVRVQAGQYEVHFETAMPDAYYAAVFGSVHKTGTNSQYNVQIGEETPTTGSTQTRQRTASMLPIRMMLSTIDPESASVAIFR